MEATGDLSLALSPHEISYFLQLPDPAARTLVPAGGTVTAQLPLRIRDLRRWEGAEDGRWVVDSGVYTVVVAKDAEAAETATTLGTVTVNGA
jgi:hypothetical protein